MRRGSLANCHFEDECRRNYWVGKMDMLFNLVDLGVVQLDLAASLAGMTMEEAADMLQGWIEAQQMPDGYYGGE